jgi:hypothetical protein
MKPIALSAWLIASFALVGCPAPFPPWRGVDRADVDAAFDATSDTGDDGLDVVIDTGDDGLDVVIDTGTADATDAVLSDDPSDVPMDVFAQDAGCADGFVNCGSGCVDGIQCAHCGPSCIVCNGPRSRCIDGRCYHDTECTSFCGGNTCNVCAMGQLCGL